MPRSIARSRAIGRHRLSRPWPERVTTRTSCAIRSSSSVVELLDPVDDGAPGLGRQRVDVRRNVATPSGGGRRRMRMTTAIDDRRRRRRGRSRRSTITRDGPGVARSVWRRCPSALPSARSRASRSAPSPSARRWRTGPASNASGRCGRRHDGDDRRLAELEPAGAVEQHDRARSSASGVRTSAAIAANAGTTLLLVGLVGQVLDAVATLGVVADGAAEQHDRAAVGPHGPV